MPRAKRTGPAPYPRCQSCNREFGATRSDAKTCSVKCRKQLSRELAAQRNGRTGLHALKNSGGVECSACGTRRDGRRKTCPVCGSVGLRITKG